MQVQERTKLTKPEIIAALFKRDGDNCMHPKCGKPLGTDITIDHIYPRGRAREDGWTEEQLWDLSNLHLMHFKCNQDKADRPYIEPGQLKPRPVRKFRYRRQKRAERPEVCMSCNAGRDLSYDEVCASCNSGPMPLRAPRWRKMAVEDCDHAIFWCVGCASGWIDRAGALEMIMIHGEGGD
jgi:hypothetical protein